MNTVKIKCPACWAEPVLMAIDGPLIGNVIRHQRNDMPQWVCQGGGYYGEQLFRIALIQKIEAAQRHLKSGEQE